MRAWWLYEGFRWGERSQASSNLHLESIARLSVMKGLEEVKKTDTEGYLGDDCTF